MIVFRVNWKHIIATFKSWRNATTTCNIGDMLLSYVFQHLGPTRRVRIPLAFPYGPYCPSVVRRSSYHRHSIVVRRVHCPKVSPGAPPPQTLAAGADPCRGHLTARAVLLLSWRGALSCHPLPRAPASAGAGPCLPRSQAACGRGCPFSLVSCSFLRLQLAGAFVLYYGVLS